MKEKTYKRKPKRDKSNLVVTDIGLATDHQSNIKEALYEAYLYSLANPFGKVTLTTDDRIVTIDTKLYNFNDDKS